MSLILAIFWLFRTKQDQMLPSNVHGNIWPNSTQFWLWIMGPWFYQQLFFETNCISKVFESRYCTSSSEEHEGRCSPRVLCTADRTTRAPPSAPAQESSCWRNFGTFGTPSQSVCGLCFSLSISFTVDNSVDHLCLSLYLILSSVLFLLPCLFSSLLIEYSSFLSLAHIRFFQQFLLYSQFLIFGCSHNCDISLFYWWFSFFCEDCSILFFVCFFVQDHCKVMPCKLR